MTPDPTTPTTPSERNWPDERDYTGPCRVCGQSFIGNKGRIIERICFACHNAQQDFDPAAAPTPSEAATPRTNEAMFHCEDDCGNCDTHVKVDFARALERELAEKDAENTKAEAVKATLGDIIEEQVRQIAALREQVHDLCHDKHNQGPVTPTDFCDGCEAFQIKLFGCSPITEMKMEIASLTRQRDEAGRERDLEAAVLDKWTEKAKAERATLQNELSTALADVARLTREVEQTHREYDAMKDELSRQVTLNRENWRMDAEEKDRRYYDTRAALEQAQKERDSLKEGEAWAREIFVEIMATAIGGMADAVIVAQQKMGPEHSLAAVRKLAEHAHELQSALDRAREDTASLDFRHGDVTLEIGDPKTRDYKIGIGPTLRDALRAAMTK